MGLPETVDFARNFAVMVRVQGPDPKGLKMRNHAFHQYHLGETTVSASGLLLPSSMCNYRAANKQFGGVDDDMVVLTVASILEPFLSQQHRQKTFQDSPKLIQGVQIDIMLEGKTMRQNDFEKFPKPPPYWLSAQLLTLVKVSLSSLALQTLVQTSCALQDHGWEVGWSLTSSNAVSQALQHAIQRQVEHDSRKGHSVEGEQSGLLGDSITTFALLGVSSSRLNDLPDIIASTSDRRGDPLLAVGSPFGVLSPIHFFNSITVGSISNCYPHGSTGRSLLMADIRCLPGMEGSPVFGEQTQFIGILTAPLRQKTSGTELQLVIPWEAIAGSCSYLLLKEPQNAQTEIHFDKNFLPLRKRSLSIRFCSDGSCNYVTKDPCSFFCTSPVERAMTSVCLITVDDGAWASGVLLNKHGLILTNAHLLEPWRFGKPSMQVGRSGAALQEIIPSDIFASSELHGVLETWNTADLSEGDTCKGHRRIHIRLDYKNHWIWSHAKIKFVSRGPLDVALLQLEHVPDQICPIDLDFTCPSLGSRTHIIGHGLFGPRCEFFPSVCSGVVSKVVKAKIHAFGQSSSQDSNYEEIPAVIETTAAVHPGGSGGAVINSNGCMIGLVTSNARHGRGTVIPYLNFSIPCALLMPVFKFSEADPPDLLLLRDLDQPNERLSSIWALTPPLSPSPGRPILPELPDHIYNGRKGSRFAKFMAESKEVFQKTTQPREAGGHVKETVPSKL